MVTSSLCKYGWPGHGILFVLAFGPTLYANECTQAGDVCVITLLCDRPVATGLRPMAIPHALEPLETS